MSVAVLKKFLLGAGMALGMVMQLPEEADETSISKRQLLAKLDVCMGGRVAEELIFGEGDVTTGASSDIEQACACFVPAQCSTMDLAEVYAALLWPRS